MMLAGQQFTVKPNRPWRRGLVWLLCLGALVLVGWQLFERGRLQAGYDRHSWQDLEVSLRQQLDELEKRNAELLGQNAILERSAEIERNAHAEVKAALAEAQTKTIKLSEELSFYRGLVSPGSDTNSGLHIQSLAIEPSNKPKQLAYRLVLSQIKQNDRYAVGTVNLRIAGTESGKARSYPLSAVTKSGEELKFKFKYFESLEGVLELPPDFKPQTIKVEILPKTDRLKSVAQEFSWDTVFSGGN